MSNTNTTQKSRDREALDLQLCIGQVVDLTSVLLTSGLTEGNHGDFLEALDDDKIDPSLRRLKAHWDLSEQDADELTDRLVDDMEFGVAVQFKTPVREGKSDPSWGCYWVHWVHASSLEKAWELGAEWARSKIAAAAEKEATHG